MRAHSPQRPQTSRHVRGRRPPCRGLRRRGITSGPRVDGSADAQSQLGHSGNRQSVRMVERQLTGHPDHRNGPADCRVVQRRRRMGHRCCTSSRRRACRRPTSMPSRIPMAFGSVTVGATASGTIAIRNVGTEPLEVTAIPGAARMPLSLASPREAHPLPSLPMRRTTSSSALRRRHLDPRLRRCS